MVGLGCVVYHGEEPWVEAVQEEDGSYSATLCGHFTLRVAGDHPFRVRMLMLFLRLLEVPGPQRGGRRTRAGRTPFVAQEKLAVWFHLPQTDISRLEKYWFTPFSQDAQPRIRGKCPLELAGYDISQVPMASLCAGRSLAWPLPVA